MVGLLPAALGFPHLEDIVTSKLLDESVIFYSTVGFYIKENFNENFGGIRFQWM